MFSCSKGNGAVNSQVSKHAGQWLKKQEVELMELMENCMLINTVLLNMGVCAYARTQRTQKTLPGNRVKGVDTAVLRLSLFSKAVFQFLFVLKRTIQDFVPRIALMLTFHILLSQRKLLVQLLLHFDLIKGQFCFPFSLLFQNSQQASCHRWPYMGFISID